MQEGNSFLNKGNATFWYRAQLLEWADPGSAPVNQF